jgi:hypothetical protein
MDVHSRFVLMPKESFHQVVSKPEPCSPEPCSTLSLQSMCLALVTVLSCTLGSGRQGEWQGAQRQEAPGWNWTPCDR